MRNEMIIDQLIPCPRPNKKSEEWKDNGLASSLNQTPYMFFLIDINRDFYRKTHSNTGTQPRCTAMASSSGFALLVAAYLHSFQHGMF
jgi:hypothetical protein